MINPNIKRMLAELKREFPDIYKVPNGLYVVISDSECKVYEDDQENFNERKIEEVDIICLGDEVAIFPSLFGGKCEVHAGLLRYENLDDVTKAIGIVGKHLKNIW